MSAWTMEVFWGGLIQNPNCSSSLIFCCCLEPAFLAAGQHMGGRACMSSKAPAHHPMGPTSHTCPCRSCCISSSASLHACHSFYPFPPLRCTFIHQSGIANCCVSHSKFFFAQTVLHANTYCKGSLVWFKVWGKHSYHWDLSLTSCCYPDTG